MHIILKRFNRILALVLATVILSACSLKAGVSGETPPKSSSIDESLDSIAALGTPTDDLYRTYYEIFAYSFCDSNGDGIGDLKGIISKLDYLEALGIEGLWLMPISPSPSYHKYDVMDYMAIDEQYGTMEDFEELLAACHDRGIRVIIDLVVNHSSSDHPWFREALKYLKNLPEGEEINIEDCPEAGFYVFNKQGGGGYSKIEGTSWYYECDFSEFMPDFNWDSPAVYREMEEIIKFWLQKGVDGFRLDAAKHYYTDQTEKNVEVLAWIQETSEKYNKDTYIVAEVWDSSSIIAKYYASGINSIFDFPFANHTGHIIKTLRGLGNNSVASDYIAKIETVEKAYKANNPDYIGAPFLSNHDTGRIANFLGGDEALIKLGGAMNLFMNGSAFIYYGEEIGLRQGATNDPSYRGPMLWDKEGFEDMTVAPPGCTLPDEYFFGDVKEQLADNSSILNYYRQAIAIRKALPVISHGLSRVEEKLNRDSVAAVRKSYEASIDIKECIILYNLNSQDTEISLTEYDAWRLAASLSVTEKKPVFIEGILTIPAYGIAILLPEK